MLIMIASVSLAVQAHSDSTPNFICNSDIDRTELTASELELEDRLWTEVLAYLDGVHSLLTTPAECLDGPEAVLQTLDDNGARPQRECINRHRDVELMIKHLDAVLSHPEAARACFDTQRNYEAFGLYAPNEEIRAADPVSSWIDRPTLNDYYEGRAGEVGEAGRELASDFASIIENTQTPEPVSSDLTANTLNTLWSAVGWIPFYAENSAALNPRFRGGYAYAEVMGPWGLLRIEEIDGETVGAEIGMTVQLGDTFYPYHYHHPQEWYVTLTPRTCVEFNRFMVMHWDNPAFEQQRVEDGWSVTVPASESASQRFMPQGTERDWLTYFERNAIHAFEVAPSCDDRPGGLVTVWARTTSRDNDQTTRICAPAHGAGIPVSADDEFVCDLDDWNY